MDQSTPLSCLKSLCCKMRRLIGWFTDQGQHTLELGHGAKASLPLVRKGQMGGLQLPPAEQFPFSLSYMLNFLIRFNFLKNVATK